jgi:hypothetical protein
MAGKGRFRRGKASAFVKTVVGKLADKTAGKAGGIAGQARARDTR